MLEYYADVYADVCVQEATIPLLLSNKDAVVQAPTGTIFFKKKPAFVEPVYEPVYEVLLLPNLICSTN